MSTNTPRLSKAQKTHVCCKPCYDNIQIIYTSTISSLKNDHYKSQNQQRTANTQVLKTLHPTNPPKPSAWQPFVDFYPLDKNGKPITDPKMVKKPTKQIRLFFAPIPNSPVGIQPSNMARDTPQSSKSKPPISSSDDDDTMEENDGIECDEKEEDDIVEGDRSVKMISIQY